MTRPAESRHGAGVDRATLDEVLARLGAAVGDRQEVLMSTSIIPVAPIEMHQVRYFLAAASELNFTKAANRCNVSQPSLTRAIKQLEGDLGGDLFRRERPRARLTELGVRVLPLLKQCYDSALGAQSLAYAINGGEIGALRIALSHTVGLDLLTAHFGELERSFRRLEIKLLRGTAVEVLELLKTGEAELAVAGAIEESWDRLDMWPLFTERFQLAVNARRPLAARSPIGVSDLKDQPFLRRGYCEDAAQIGALLRTHGMDVDRGHEVSSDDDLIALLEANVGVAFAPLSLRMPKSLARVPVDQIELSRTVYLYGIAGRRRTAVASAMLKTLRAADWSRFCN